MTDTVWQPISTAPRDGTEFLAYWPATGWMSDIAWAIERTWWDGKLWQTPQQYARPEGDEAPTYWLPMSVLPDLPSREVRS